MLNTENIAVYLILLWYRGGAFQSYWRTDHDDSRQKRKLKNTF
jgi:hypothetical protein